MTFLHYGSFTVLLLSSVWELFCLPALISTNATAVLLEGLLLRNKYLTISRLLLATLVFYSLGGFSVLADFSLRDWRYAKTINLPDNLRQEGLVEIGPDR